MKTFATTILVALMVALISSCSTNDKSVKEEYARWEAKYDSSLHYHSLVHQRHEVMMANHEELENFMATMENPDEELMAEMAQHSKFYAEHEEIMKNHAGIMKRHREFREKYESTKMTDEEVLAELEEIEHDHYHMDIDHEYVLKMTTQIRKEHNDMRRRLNELLAKK